MEEMEDDEVQELFQKRGGDSYQKAAGFIVTKNLKEDDMVLMMHKQKRRPQPKQFPFRNESYQPDEISAPMDGQ